MGKRKDPDDLINKDKEIQRMEEDFTEEDYALLEEMRKMMEDFE